VECTVQALMVERSRAAQHVKSPVTMLPSALRGTLRAESIALPICFTYYSVFTYYCVFHSCRCDYNELLLIRNSITRKNGWYRRPPKFWVVSESIPQKRVVWESIAVNRMTRVKMEPKYEVYNRHGGWATTRKGGRSLSQVCRLNFLIIRHHGECWE
jgi:hypothetical protein